MMALECLLTLELLIVDGKNLSQELQDQVLQDRIAGADLLGWVHLLVAYLLLEVYQKLEAMKEVHLLEVYLLEILC